MKYGTFVRSPRQLRRLANKVGRPVRSMGAYIENGGERVYGRVADVGYGKTMAVLANGETAMVAEKALSVASAGTAVAGVGVKVGAKLAPRVFALAGLKTASHFIPYVGWGLAIIGGTKEAVKAAYRHSQYGWEPKALPRDLLKVTAGVIGIEDLFDWYPRAEKTVAKNNPMRRPTATLRAHVHSDATTLSLLLTDGGRPQGYLHLYSVNGQTAVPTAAAAEKGYGPLLYDLGAILSGWTIYPSKERSPSAKAFWSKQKGPFVPLRASEFEKKYGRHPDDLVDEDFQHVPAAEYWSSKYLGQFRTNTGWRRPWAPRDADMKRVPISGFRAVYVFRMPSNDPERVYRGFGFYLERDNGTPGRNHLFEFDITDGRVTMGASDQDWLRSVISFNYEIRNGDEIVLNGLQRALKPVRNNPPRTPVTLYHPRLGLFIDVPGYDPIMLASVATVRSLYIENKLLRRKRFPPPPPLRFRNGKPTDYTLGVLEVYVRSILSDAGTDIRPLERVNRRKNPAMASRMSEEEHAPDCAWCGAACDQPRPYPNERGEVFCSPSHRSSSNRALARFTGAPARPSTRRKNPAPVAYLGVILDDPNDLLSWWRANVGPTLPKAYAHHMTSEFKPKSVDAHPVGHTEYLQIVGYAQNEHVQAVVVQGYPSKNAVPHITVATDGSPPVLSNDLLAGGYIPVANGPYLRGRVGFNQAGKDVLTLAGA